MIFYISNSKCCICLCLGLYKWVWNEHFQKVQVQVLVLGEHLKVTYFQKFYSKSWPCVQCSCLNTGTLVKSASLKAFTNGPSVWSELQVFFLCDIHPSLSKTKIHLKILSFPVSLLLSPKGHGTVFKPHTWNAPQQLVKVSRAHLLSFANSSQLSSSPCNLYIHTTHPVFKEFLEKGGDFNQERSQIPQLAHTHCFKSPAIGSGRSQPH